MYTCRLPLNHSWANPAYFVTVLCSIEAVAKPFSNSNSINFKPQKDQDLETHHLVRISILQKGSIWVLKDPFLGANYH